MAQRYQNVMVAIDGSKEADLAFVKGVYTALRNESKLTIAHVIDTRALQSVSTFDAEVYEELQVDAESLMKEYEKRARDAGVTDIHIVIEMGNPKTLLARTIPDAENVDLILVGATGLNAFERLLVGSSSATFSIFQYQDSPIYSAPPIEAAVISSLPAGISSPIFIFSFLSD